MIKNIIAIKRSVYICFLCLCLLLSEGCADKSDTQREQTETAEIPDKIETYEQNISKPEITAVDWSGYFEGLNGAAVIYDDLNEEYRIYNEELALTQHSPCSTFKIISSYIALESGIIQPDDSIREWSGEIFWNENWNRDIDFREAFRVSCIWYFREVINEIGPERMQE